MTGIDWKRMLKEIEREYDGLPPAPSLGSLKAKEAAERAAKEAAREANVDHKRARVRRGFRPVVEILRRGAGSGDAEIQTTTSEHPVDLISQ